MVSTLRSSFGIGKALRLPNSLWKSPVANLPSWPALLGLLVTFSIIVVLTTCAIHHDGMYSPLNRSQRSQYTALHNAYLESATRFFSGSHGREEDLGFDSDQSQAAASFEIGKDVSRVSISVVVMVSKRRVPYVQIWAWSLLTGSSATDLNQTVVTVINTQKPSSANNEDLQPIRDAGIPVVDMYDGDGNGADGWNRKAWSDWILDEYLCHIEALKACDKVGVSWCIMFEEDSLLTQNLLGKFRTHVLEELEARDNVGMVKLFTTDAWIGYQWPGWPQDLLLIPCCLASALILPFCYLIVRANSMLCEKRRRNASLLLSSTPRPKRKISFLKLALCWGTVFGNMVIVAEVMSRQSVVAMLDFPAIHIDPAMSAASAVAVAFPIQVTRKLREHLERVVQSESKARWFPIDLEVYEWAVSLGLSVLKTSPSLAQHIGLFSSNPRKEHVLYLNQDSRFTILVGENLFQRAMSRMMSAW